jgi:hypothetical protein
VYLVEGLFCVCIIYALLYVVFLVFQSVCVVEIRNGGILPGSNLDEDKEIVTNRPKNRSIVQ